MFPALTSLLGGFFFRHCPVDQALKIVTWQVSYVAIRVGDATVPGPSWDANFGQNLTRLTDVTHQDHSPDWSPNGNKIAFSRYSEGIFVMDTDGSNEIQLTSGSDMMPKWSPTGNHIAFSRGGVIYVVNAHFVRGEPSQYPKFSEIERPVPLIETAGSWTDTSKYPPQDKIGDQFFWLTKDDQ